MDISQPLDLGTAQCMVQNGMTFGIVRGWCSYGGFDSNVVGSIANMWSAGFAHVDSYMFPCPGQDATAQVNSFVSQLSSNGVQYGMIWFDIETNGSDNCGWSDPADNCNYMQALVNAAAANGVNYGIYASAYMWGSIMGDGCTVGGSNPLWYADYDGNADFGDWASFGGWSTPAMVCSFSRLLIPCLPLAFYRLAFRLWIWAQVEQQQLSAPPSSPLPA